MSDRDEFIELYRHLDAEDKKQIHRLLNLCLTPGFSEAYTARLGPNSKFLPADEVLALMDEWEAQHDQ